MLKYIKLKKALSLLMVLAVLFNACNDDETGSSKIELNSFGPSVLRGGELMFIGKNLDKVTAIVLPGNVELQPSAFTEFTPTLIRVAVPEQTEAGFVTLKTPDGDIVTKTSLSILEPITITKLPTAAVRPGEVITIEGTYLNLIQEVIFATSKSVTDFEAQSKTSLSVRVPDDAQSGILILVDNQKIPNSIKTKTEIGVTLPSITALSPAPVKAGQNLTITGTNLDLASQVIFNGGVTVSTFVSKSATSIVVTVPDNAKEGAVNLTVASKVAVQSTQTVALVVPAITSLTPNPAKNGAILAVKGTDLDLVSKITFGGNLEGEIQSGRTATDINVKVPEKAITGTLTFSTKADKSVTSSSLAMVKPAITSIAPLSVQMDNDITITGTNLDLVKEIKFKGDTKTSPTTSSATQLVVKVPLGTKSGAITLVASNGDEVVSTDMLTILANVPDITSITSMAKPGDKITITGTKLNLTDQVIFPDNIKATMFGNRTATQLEVYIPDNAKKGKVKVKLVTFDNQQTETPEINVSGADPVKDASLVFFNFNGKNSWWGGVVIENDPALSLDGTSYGKLDMGTLTGWTDFFWRNGKNDFPITTIGTNVNDYVLKFDIYVRSSITGGNLKFRLGEYWWGYGPASPTSPAVVPVSDGWMTVTVQLSDFRDNYGWGAAITDFNVIGDGQFGAAWDNGSSDVDLLIDNVRFEHK